MKMLFVAGARPNFMKIVPLVHELSAQSSPSSGSGFRKPERAGSELSHKLVHTGQHYDYEMSKAFFEDFDLPEPDYFLNAGSGSHAEQTGKVMIEFEKVCVRERPDMVVVVGDVNSTLACSVTAKKSAVPVAHVEAGLRSGDKSMPEEINRIVTDALSDYLFVTEKSGMENLKKEGKADKQIHFVGNIMIDTLLFSLKKLEKHQAEAQEEVKSNEGIAGKRRGQKSEQYAVVTLHRPSNVDEKEKLMDILLALQEISRERPVYFPIHPRTKKNIEDYGLGHILENSNIESLPPLPYLEFLALWKDAALVLTDSGGLQEETTALGIPCFTIRENTERPVTIEEGTNILVGTTGEQMLEEYERFRNGHVKKGKVPELWDGRAAERIITVIKRVLWL